MMRAFLNRLKLLVCLLLPNPGFQIKLLKRTREKGMSSAKHVDQELMLLQIKIIKNFLERKIFFNKSPKDLAHLVNFCGNPEFYDQEILGTVLVEVFERRRGFLKCYRMCAPILATRESVCHYMSRCNKDFLRLGTVRFTEFILDWLVKLLCVHCELLGIMDPGILREILRRGTKDVYGQVFFQLKFWEKQNDEGVSPYALADLVYACFVALYVFQTHKMDAETLARSTASHNVLNCLSIILSAVPNISIKLVYARGQVLNYPASTAFVIDKVLRWLCRSTVLPNFHERLGMLVPSLKHLSRCKIRAVLYDNWRLPEGIYQLDVPKILHGYLDLDYD